MTILAIMFTCHFIADFLLQSREMGKTKSTKFKVLLAHIGIQYSILFIGLIFFIGPEFAFKISGLNALVHGVIDWYIWRGYKWSVYSRIKQNPNHKLTWLQDGEEGWVYWEDHYFYVTIGLDQLLHGLTLIALAGLYL